MVKFKITKIFISKTEFKIFINQLYLCMANILKWQNKLLDINFIGLKSI